MFITSTISIDIFQNSINKQRNAKGIGQAWDKRTAIRLFIFYKEIYVDPQIQFFLKKYVTVTMIFFWKFNEKENNSELKSKFWQIEEQRESEDQK